MAKQPRTRTQTEETPPNTAGETTPDAEPIDLLDEIVEQAPPPTEQPPQPSSPVAPDEPVLPLAAKPAAPKLAAKPAAAPAPALGAELPKPGLQVNDPLKHPGLQPLRPGQNPDGTWKPGAPR